MAGQAPAQPQAAQPADVAHIHMPAPSIFPLVLSLGVGTMGLGLIIDWYRIVLIGASVVILSIIGMGFEYADFGQLNRTIPSTRRRPAESTCAKSASGRSSARSAYSSPA